MEAEQIKNALRDVDAMFFAEVQWSPEEAMSQLGTMIVKAATDEAMPVEQLKATMQTSYLLATKLNEWTEREGQEHVSVPAFVSKAVQEFNEGGLQNVIPVSEALTLITKRLKEPTPPVSQPETVGKAAPPSWAPDMAAPEDAGETDGGWGPDPAGLRD